MCMQKVVCSVEYSRSEFKQFVHYCSSALNSQSVRVMILLDDPHVHFWTMLKHRLNIVVWAHSVKRAILKIKPYPDIFSTIWFFEDQDTVGAL